MLMAKGAIPGQPGKRGGVTTLRKGDWPKGSRAGESKAPARKNQRPPTMSRPPYLPEKKKKNKQIKTTHYIRRKGGENRQNPDTGWAVFGDKKGRPLLKKKKEPQGPF